MRTRPYGYPFQKEYEIKHQEKPTYTLLKKIVNNTKKISDKEKSLLQYFIEKGKGKKKYDTTIKTNKQNNNTIERRLNLEKGELFQIYKSLEEKKLLIKDSYNEDIYSIFYTINKFNVMMLRQGTYNGNNGENVINIFRK